MAFVPPVLTSPPAAAASSPAFRLRSAATKPGDTPEILPDFASKDDYLKYMEGASALPKGFATGTASGTFVSVEAPALGALPIRATVIHLTEGPTDNWAAVFTSNKVRASVRVFVQIFEPPMVLQ
jgi:hypothetical protein